MPSVDISEAKRKLEEVKENTVVLLGCYNGEHKTFLENIGTILQVDYGYGPMLLEEFYKVPSETPRQAVHNIISSCNFVIADDTVPSGESLELEYCRNCGAVTAIVCRFHEKQWSRSTFMTCDFSIHSLDFEIFKFNSKVYKMDEIKKLVKRIVKWKNDRKAEIARRMKIEEANYKKHAKKSH